MRQGRQHRRRTPAGLLLAGTVACIALAAIAGGLLRAGIALPGASAWGPAAAGEHATLMVACLMGTMIGVERAVALRLPAAWFAPALSAAAGIALLAGTRGAAGALLVLSALGFVAVNALLVRRQRAAHTALLLAGSMASLAGNGLYAASAAPAAMLAFWFGFLVLTIAAERLEMTRLMRRRPGAQGALFAILALLAGGAVLSAFAPAAGGVLYGAALVLLASWLLAYDIARRTVFTHGLPRYMAVCLLAGYGWLAAGGLAWMATAAGLGWRDAALHALGLGFIGSMVMGHAPVILPAVAGAKVRFGAAFYLPLGLLHASLVVRLVPGAADPAWMRSGAAWNAIALALFAATLAGASWAWRRQHRAARPARAIDDRQDEAAAQG